MYLPQRNHTTEGTKRLIVILIEFVFNLFSSCLGKTFYTCIVWFVFNFGSNILIMKLLRHFKKPVCPKGYLHWSDQYLRKRLKAGNKYGLKKASIILQNLGFVWIQLLSMNCWLDLCQHTQPWANVPGDYFPASLNAGYLHGVSFSEVLNTSSSCCSRC